MKKHNHKSKILVAVYLLVFLSLAFLANVNFTEIFSLPENFVASYSDIESANENSSMGSFVRATLEEPQKSVDSQNERYGTVVFKLFNLIPIRKVNVKILPEQEVYVGGVPIGLNLETNGAVVLSDTSVMSDEGHVETIKNKELRSGDIIRKVDGKEVSSIKDLEKILNETQMEEVKVEFIRKNEEKSSIVKLHKDDGGRYKMGIWVRDDISGIGTLTYVDKDNNFGALGHAVTDGESIVPITDGKIYECSLLGIDKGQKNAPGELKCLFLQSDERGDIEKNTQFGIFGHLHETTNLIDNNLSAKLGGRLGVAPGRAKIVSSVSGIREEYDIEIIKASYQSKSSDKSIVFRVVDKRLLELTGGIVQGMSGSPIMQNGKIIGAVTHVFLSDPTKGYGVYTDWMLGE